MSETDNGFARFPKDNVYERHYELDMPAGRVEVGVRCQNIPTDGFIEARMPGLSGETAFDVPKMPVHHANMLVIHPLTFPEPFRATMTIRYYLGSQVPGQSASVTPVVIIPFEDLR
ncbi:hypothetical protein LJY25_03730 [Hymenobacter sp. BT175]|uniref:hypothetical protein n=1 Tax=Hymenobacter translucens TaxID=2886507 RepID=UPI001D0DCFE0|nr:hypothetical protein [Hymenobacter translucens]MCC2545542.1 hypothetical protein [Hymenobacter translucens]